MPLSRLLLAFACFASSSAAAQSAAPAAYRLVPDFRVHPDSGVRTFTLTDSAKSGWRRSHMRTGAITGGAIGGALGVIAGSFYNVGCDTGGDCSVGKGRLSLMVFSGLEGAAAGAAIGALIGFVIPAARR
jgi:hypothetical protein